MGPDHEAILKQKLPLIWPYLNERSRRLIAAAEAVQFGRGGISLLSRISGLSRVTITKGLRELEDKTVPTTRIRREGAGRPCLLSVNPKLLEALESLLKPRIRGGPESPLCWISNSTRGLAKELVKQNHSISHEKVAQYLRSLNYCLQGTRNAEKGVAYQEQFRTINQKVCRAMAAQNPVISIQIKRKEKIGQPDPTARTWTVLQKKKPVNGADFQPSALPHPHPSGLYDLGLNQGFVTLEAAFDTAAFALASIRGWWQEEGQRLFPQATGLLITADCGSSRGYRNQRWKVEGQGVADKIGLPVSICHFPPGIYKWNNVEHLLFPIISTNWRGEPLLEEKTIVNLISKIPIAKGLSLICRLDRRKYRRSQKISEAQLTTLKITPDPFQGQWNYTVRPR